MSAFPAQHSLLAKNFLECLCDNYSYGLVDQTLFEMKHSTFQA